MSTGTGILQVYRAGKQTIVGFGSLSVLDHVNVVQCRDELIELINQHNCAELGLDLTGVKVLPSGMLGVLGSMHQLGVAVVVFNPSEEDQEVLKITQLDRVIEPRLVDGKVA